jgi:ribosomal protein S18 acetylase RimI-like enzyme
VDLHADTSIRKRHSCFSKLYTACTSDLLSKDIFQWDKSYPTKEHITYHVNQKELFVLKEERGTIVGAVVLNESQSPEWETVNWKFEKPLIIHMLAVNPSFQNGGLGKMLLDFSEQFAISQDYHSIRLDSFANNEKSLAFYQRAGYEHIGAVMFTGKREGHETYNCFEKLLNG